MIQLAKAKGIHTVNVVRPRADFYKLEAHLQGVGADIVTTDDELKSALGKCACIIMSPMYLLANTSFKLSC